MQRVRWDCPQCQKAYAVAVGKTPKGCPKCGWKYREPTPTPSPSQTATTSAVPTSPEMVFASIATSRPARKTPSGYSFSHTTATQSASRKRKRKAGDFQWVGTLVMTVLAAVLLYLFVTVFDNKASPKEKYIYLRDAFLIVRNVSILSVITVAFFMPMTVSKARKHPFRVPIIVLNASLLGGLMIWFVPIQMFYAETREELVSYIVAAILVMLDSRMILAGALFCWAIIMAWATMPLHSRSE